MPPVFLGEAGGGVGGVIVLVRINCRKVGIVRKVMNSRFQWKRQQSHRDGSVGVMGPEYRVNIHKTTSCLKRIRFAPTGQISNIKGCKARN